MIAHHAAIGWSHAQHHGETFTSLLEHWDGSHYSTIIQEGGHYGLRRAFFPLYPTLVRVIHGVVGGAIPIVGALLSTLCLLLFVLLSAIRSREGPSSLRPESPWGWFFFLYGPASFALHSHHTEGLFLLLSFGALTAAADGRVLFAGLLCAFSVWTRNQGVFVTVAAAWLAASSGPHPLRRFAGVSGLGVIGFLLFLAYQAAVSGHPLAFLQAQSHWSHAHSPLEVLRTFWFGNPWQAPNQTSVARHIFFVLQVALIPLLWRSSRPLALYCALSLMPLPLQGELINTFRFSAVLFPIAFWLGELAARSPRWLPWAAVPLWVSLNHWVTLEYARASWAY